MKPTRGFHGRGNRDPRLPPGQYDVGRDWPVLTAEATPKIPTDDWTFSIGGLVARPMKWTWEEIQALPDSTYTGRHPLCDDVVEIGGFISRRFGRHASWRGRPAVTASHVLATTHTGYTTNLPLEDVTGGQAWVVWEFGGEPLAREHGGPARLLVPHLYFWKSAKWVPA